MFQNIINPDAFINAKEHEPCNCPKNIYTGIPVDPGTSFVTTGQVLKQSQGFAYAHDNLIAAVSNSSVSGMSGSCILQRKYGR